MDTSILDELGLNKIETALYLDLVRHGESKVAEISLRAGLHRTTSYYILDLLEKKGLVSYVIKSGVKQYLATNPERLVGLVEERLHRTKLLAHDLCALYPAKKDIPVIETYEDKEGIKSIWEDVLKESRENSELRILATGKAKELLPHYMPSFHARRQKKRISMHILYNDIPSTRKRGKELATLKLTDVRFIAKEYPLPISTLIYGSCVAFIIWNETILTGIIMRDRQVNANFGTQFEMLWKTAIK